MTLIAAVIAARWLVCLWHHDRAAATAVIAAASTLVGALAAIAAFQAARGTRDAVRLQAQERHWHVRPVLAVPDTSHVRIDGEYAVIALKNFGTGPAIGVQSRLRITFATPPVTKGATTTAVNMHLVFVRYSEHEVAPIIPVGESFPVKVRLPHFLHSAPALPQGWELEVTCVDTFRQSVHTMIRDILGVPHSIPHEDTPLEGWGKVGIDDPWTVLYVQGHQPTIGAKAAAHAASKGWDLSMPTGPPTP